jgi:uncharacterized protein (DUF4415 family)
MGMLILEEKTVVWDENKNRKNVRDHGIALYYNEDHLSVEKMRRKGLGVIRDSLLLMVCFTEEKNELRLYSAREALPKEKGGIVTTSIKFSETKNLPPITAERIEKIKAFNNTDFSDCPEITDEDWQRARPAYPVTKAPKVDVHMPFTPDVLDWLKAPGKGYQARLNAALRYSHGKWVLGEGGMYGHHVYHP